MATSESVNSIVADAKHDVKSHDFMNVYHGIDMLQRHDGGVGSARFKSDMSDLNNKLQQQGILSNLDIVGVDDKNHIITRNGLDFEKQNAASMNEGSTQHHGLFGFISHTVGDVVHDVVHHPLQALTDAALPVVGIVDGVAHTHIAKAIDDVIKGGANEVIHHPGTILKDAAIGAGIAALTVATGGGFEVGLGIASAALVASEAIKNRKDGYFNIHELTGAAHDGEGLADAARGWVHDTAVVAGDGKHSAQQEAAAQKGLEGLGAFGAQTTAGIAGGFAGGIGADAAGLDGAIPNSIKSVMAGGKDGLTASAESDATAAVTTDGAAAATETNSLTAEELAVQKSVETNQNLFRTGADDGEITPSVKQAYNVRFEKVTEPTQIRTLEGLKTGTTETAQPGTWIATRLDADGTPNIENGIENSWPVSEKAMLKTYQIDPEELKTSDALVAGTKTDAPPVNMVALKAPLTIQTPWGTMSGEPGDYLANYDYNGATGTPGSDYAIVTKSSYGQTYEPVGDAGGRRA